MQVAIYSTQRFERPYLTAANSAGAHELLYLEARLNLATAGLAQGCEAASIFVSDDASAPVLRALAAGGTRVLVLRSAGFNHVDVAEATRLGMTVLRVPAYSPHAVAEHTVGLMLCLNRRLHRAFNRVREQNFALDGLMGFDMFGKVAGVVGTGKIGEQVCRILRGFGCEVLAFDPSPSAASEALGVRYVALEQLYAQADLLTLHCPLTPGTRHLLDASALASLKPGVMLINTSRGALIDSRALIDALKSGHLGAVGLDVYEEEEGLFFQDHSGEILHDEVFARLMTFPNVLITAHQGFFTQEAVTAIAQTTIANLSGFASGQVVEANRVLAAARPA